MATDTTLEAHLKTLGIEASLSSILMDLASANERIYDSIDLRTMGKDGAENVSGDVQSSLDVEADRIIASALDANRAVCSHFNEECQELRTCSASGSYFVAYDPYDGGSIGDVNITASSIFGIWSETPKLGEMAGKNMVAGAYALWGPKLVFAWGTKANGVYWYERDKGIFQLRGRADFDTAGRHKKIFCPGDMALLLKDEAYRALLEHVLALKYSVRYAASCGTDTHHVLLHGGCFWYPKSEKRPDGHLRLMYECAPLGFLVECAGGISTSHAGKSILDITITNWHQRTPIFLSGPTPEMKVAAKIFSGIGPQV